VDCHTKKEVNSRCQPTKRDLCGSVALNRDSLKSAIKNRVIYEKNLFCGPIYKLLVFAMMAPDLRAVERREFISKTINPEVQKLLKNCDREIIAEEPFSSTNNNIMDYMIGFYDTDSGLLVTLQTLRQRLDEHGRAIPDVYTTEPVAIVFVDRSLLWYKSEIAKSTLKTKMAQLMGKQAI